MALTNTAGDARRAAPGSAVNDYRYPIAAGAQARYQVRAPMSLIHTLCRRKYQLFQQEFFPTRPATHLKGARERCLARPSRQHARQLYFWCAGQFHAFCYQPDQLKQSRASRSSGEQATRYSRPIILTSRKFGSALISGILGQLVHQAFEALTGSSHRLAQMQALGLQLLIDLVFQHIVLGAQLAGPARPPVQSCASSASISVFIAPNYRGKNAAWSRTKPLFSK